MCTCQMCQNITDIVTARIRSMGKVMFSHASDILFTGAVQLYGLQMDASHPPASKTDGQQAGSTGILDCILVTAA